MTLPKRILWVDNDIVPGEDPRIKALNMAGFVVEVGVRVMEAEEKLRSESFALVILDIMIPTLRGEVLDYPQSKTDVGHTTGIVFYERMKSFLDERDIPLVVFSIVADKVVEDRFLALGLPEDRYLLKADYMDVSKFVEKITAIV